MLGSLRSKYEDSQKEDVGGDLAMFIIPPEDHADIINDNETNGDVYNLGKVTPEDVVSILKVVYREDYKDMLKQGVELRKKKGEDTENEEGSEEDKECQCEDCEHIENEDEYECEDCKIERALEELTKQHEAMTNIYIQ